MVALSHAETGLQYPMTPHDTIPKPCIFATFKIPNQTKHKGEIMSKLPIDFQKELRIPA